jgi:hypothetical protein
LPDNRESEQREVVTEAEAHTIMKTHGWTFIKRTRRTLGTKYLYAQRRQGYKLAERYICPFSKLGNLTEQELVAKLTQPPAEKL